MKTLFAVLLMLFSSIAFAQSNVLTWDYPAAETRETGFRIERKAEPCANPGTFAEIAAVAANIITFTDSNVTEGQTYCYRVRAAGAGGLFSAYSNTAQRTVPFTAPAAPSNLQVQGGP